MSSQNNNPNNEITLAASTLEINLNALEANLKYYRSFLRPGTKVVCMVKANAYGAGAVRIAQTLQDMQADYLAVATTFEGIELRKAGISLPILVLNPDTDDLRPLFAHCLEPEAYSFRLLDALSQQAAQSNASYLPIHIKIDTGMHRLGFNPRTDIGLLISKLKDNPRLMPVSVFSHLVGSDDESLDNFSLAQFADFSAAADRIQSAFSHKILRHICNSAAIQYLPQCHLDMVRLGLGLYGINPRGNQPLYNVSELKTKILQIHPVKSYDTVGYNKRGTLSRNSHLATLAIGYADGLSRRLGCGRAYCLVNGQKAPYVGNICMDVCMIDVTGIDCREGDTALIFGTALPVTVLSDAAGTIPYEILTSIGRRVQRVYLRKPLSASMPQSS